MMESAKILTILVLALALIVCVANVSEAAPVGTAFTYQGRLIDTNDAADGLYDFQFKLYDDPCGPGQAADDINKPDVDVIDGYFTVELDFGFVFGGDARWLEIGIRPGEVNDPNVYTPLEPRQEVTATPYAIYAKYGDDWMVSGNDMYSVPSGNVGIGTMDPQNKLDVEGAAAIGATYSGTESAPTDGMIVEGNMGIGTESPSHRLHVAGDANITGDLYAGSGSTVLRVDDATDRVGVGTSSPQSKLHVASSSSAWGMMRLDNTNPGDNEVTISFWDGSTAAGADIWFAGVGPWGNSNDFMIGRQGESSRFMIDVAGNVGIGTTDPQSRLHVSNGWVKTEEGYGLEMVHSGGQGSTLFITGSELNVTNNAAGDIILNTGTSPGVTQPRVVIKNDGKVGIGTEPGGYALEVDGYVSAFTTSGPGLIQVNDKRASGGPWNLYSGKLTQGDFSINESEATNVERLYIEAGGNVGIGITDPNAKLHVNGDLNVTGAFRGNISSSSGSDGAPFPRPAYDSGWESLSQGEAKRLTHNVGGNVDNYFVDLTAKDGSGTHIFGIGYNWGPSSVVGFFYNDLTNSQVRIARGPDDLMVASVRVRIWVYK